MTTTRYAFLSLVVLSVSMLTTACASEIDREIDCVTICQEYQDCLPGDQDEAECRDRCDNATTSEVDACDACIDSTETCTPCTTECAAPLAGA